MDPRTRSNISTGVDATLFVFCNGLVHERLSTTTNFTFGDLKKRRQFLLVNVAPCEHGDSGTLIGALLKYDMQRFILGQAAGPGDPIGVINCDEAQQWSNSADPEFNAQSRSHRGCMIFVTQSIEAFPASMRDEAGKRETMALLSNFGTKIVHALGSVETAKWLSESLGMRLETRIGGSTQQAGSVFDEWAGQSQSSCSFASDYAPVLQPRVFLTGLTRMGGPQSGYVSDAIVMRTGKAFSNGENWITVTFSQR